jgi:hypothetical protein
MVTMLTIKEKESAKISAQIEEFLTNGGKINVLEKEAINRREQLAAFNDDDDDVLELDELE